MTTYDMINKPVDAYVVQGQARQEWNAAYPLILIAPRDAREGVSPTAHKVLTDA